MLSGALFCCSGEHIGYEIGDEVSCFIEATFKHD